MATELKLQALKENVEIVEINAIKVSAGDHSIHSSRTILNRGAMLHNSLARTDPYTHSKMQFCFKSIVASFPLAK